MHPLCRRKYEHCSKRYPCDACETAKPAIPYDPPSLAEEVKRERAKIAKYLTGKAYRSGECTSYTGIPCPYEARYKRERLEACGYL